MALPSSYLTSTKNLSAILGAIRGAQAPTTFTTRFLADLGFKSSSDRLVVAVLKMLGLLQPGGQPTERYFRFLDASQSKKVLAEGIREAYADLFQLNVNAHKLPRAEVKEKFKTLTQGQHKDSVLDKMAMTFKALSEQADFTGPSTATEAQTESPAELVESEEPIGTRDEGRRISGLVYNIEIHLPESRDPAVYDALFQSLRKHLID